MCKGQVAKSLLVSLLLNLHMEMKHADKELELELGNVISGATDTFQREGRN